jgi:hypothetical protein
MRILCVAVGLTLLSSAGSAQTGLRSASLPDRTPTGPPPPPLILRSASLPDRTAMETIVPVRPDQFLARPDTYTNRPDREPFLPIGFGYAPDIFVPFDSTRGGRRAAKGYLQMDVQPPTAQVYVDGTFMGSVDDFRKLIPGRALDAGPHRIEVRAPGYETLTFDVMIFANETITYRNTLTAVPDAERTPAPRVVAGVPKTFYVIPRCYAGDKPPRSGALRPGCNVANTRTIPAVVSTVRKPTG